MKSIVITMMMVATVTHAATNGVSVAVACNVPEQLASLYENMTITLSNGVSVVCNVSERLVMVYELKTPITITVSNGTENAIPFIRDISYAYDAQLWVDLGDKYQFVHPPRFGLRERKQWNPTLDLSKLRSDWWLNPGESASWELDYIKHVGDILDYASDNGTSNITVRVQLGHNQWASSETQPFHVVPRFLDYPPDAEYWAQYKVAEFEYVDERNKTRKAPFFVIPIKGKRILFGPSCPEVCELQGDEKPEFQFDKETSVVSISQADKKRVRYNLKTMKAEADAPQM